MAGTNTTEQQDGKLFGLCGKKDEEKTHGQNHDDIHPRPMEEPKHSSETEGKTQQGGLMQNLPLGEVILETHEAEQKGLSGMKNEEETHEPPPADNVKPPAVVEPEHPSDSEGKTYQKLNLPSSFSSSAPTDGEGGEKEEEKKKIKGSVKDKIKEKIHGHHEKKEGEEHSENKED